MIEEKQYSGSDVSKAIANACKDLGATQDKLNIEVVAPGSAGFLGVFGKKAATVKVSLKNKGGQAADPHHKKRGRGERPSKGPARGSASTRAPEKAPAEILQSHLDEVKNDLEKILELMGFPAAVEVTNEANKITARIGGDIDEAIIGPEGQTLDSIQYLMRKIISRRIEGKVMFSLDAGDYRNRRRDELEEKALKLAEEVKVSGRTKSIPALNPAERRIVHMTLQADRSIRSRSVGDGHFKKILIYVPTQGKKQKNR
ncbi:MAG: Jag N-terminal domain-containing protein [Desulfobulbales bacterium]|nr:Jag N-terminal domain-containing protein [Desulfobulbales bacterium]